MTATCFTSSRSFRRYDPALRESAVEYLNRVRVVSSIHACIVKCMFDSLTRRSDMIQAVCAFPLIFADGPAS